MVIDRPMRGVAKTDVVRFSKISPAYKGCAANASNSYFVNPEIEKIYFGCTP